MFQLNFMAEENRLNKLSELGDSLERLKVIDWEKFRPILNKYLKKEDKQVSGRPSYDYILLFKVLILQRLFNLSDEQTEYQINDRMSFMRFLNLSLDNKVPDARTIWLFRDNLVKTNAIQELFALFGAMLEDKGIITHSGTIVDATIVTAPRQRNTREDNATLKADGVPEDWKKQDKKSRNKLRHKDVDARWTKKGQDTYYGYKDHAKVDVDSKIITKYAVTTANVHDSNEFEDFIDEQDNVVYADSAYYAKKRPVNIPEHVRLEVNEKGCRYSKMTEEQKLRNRAKSRIRARVEHVFGFMTNSMNGITVRSIGIERAKFNIGLTNLIYNMCRFEFLTRPEKVKNNG